MPMTKKQYVERVRGAALALGKTLDPKLIGYAMGDALDELGDQVFKAGIPLLEKEFNVNCDAEGTADLSSVTDALMNNIIVSSVSRVRGSNNQTKMWQWVPSRLRLYDEKTPLDRVWYTIEGNTIYAMGDDGVTPPSDEIQLLFKAHYSPVIGAVPNELTNKLIEIGLRLNLAPEPEPEVKAA